MIIVAHSDNFRWFGPEKNLDEWDSVIQIFNNHGYKVTDATDKEFVGIKISRDEQIIYWIYDRLHHRRG
jgi:phage major head subunit gpT-like protein